eukprot:3213193-Rhodomonas_salina.1
MSPDHPVPLPMRLLGRRGLQEGFFLAVKTDPFCLFGCVHLVTTPPCVVENIDLPRLDQSSDDVPSLEAKVPYWGGAT